MAKLAAAAVANEPRGKVPFAAAAALAPYGEMISPYGKTTLPYGATLPPYGATAAAYGETTLPYGATRPPYGARAAAYSETTWAYGSRAAAAVRRPMWQAPSRRHVRARRVGDEPWAGNELRPL